MDRISNMLALVAKRTFKRPFATNARIRCLLQFLMSLVIVAGLSACNGDSTQVENLEDTRMTEGRGAGIPMPAAFKSKPLPENGTLRAYVIVDGGSRQEMEISGGQARLSLRGLSLGQHSFNIIYEFDSTDFGEGILLASATQTSTISSGSNRLTFDEDNYDVSFDEDDDTVSNLDELNAGADPRTANSQLAITTAVPASILSSGDSLSNGSLRAYLSVGNSPRQEMLIADNQVSLSLNTLLPGEQSFEIVFEFDSSTFGNNIELARASQNTTLEVGPNMVSFSEAYDTSADGDEDGVSNLEELNAGLDPRTGNAMLAVAAAVPEVVNDANLTDGNLRAYVVIDESPRRELAIENGDASLSLRGLIPGESSVEIIYEFDSQPFGDGIELARFTLSATLVVGENSLVFSSDEDYDTSADNDSDGVSNLAELIAGINPLSANATASITSILPSQIRLADLPDGVLVAFLSVDSEARLPMTVDGDEISIQLSGLEPGARSFQLILEFNSPNFGSEILLGTATQIVNLVAGPNGLALDNTGYDFSANDDVDGLNNIEELLAGRNPRVKEDPQAPSVAINFPPQESLSDGETVTIRGTAEDVSEITSLSVNGIVAVSNDGFENWSAIIQLMPGANDLTVEVSDDELNTSSNAGQVTIQRETTMISPRDITVDATNNRALIVDQNLDAVVSLDLNSGVPTIISNRTTPNSNNPLDFPQGIELDLANNRALILESFDGGIIAVDLDSGERTVLSNNAMTSPGAPNFIDSNNIAFDASSNRVLVAEGLGLGSIIAVDANNGARTILSDESTPNANNPLLSAPWDIAIDASNNRALVVDSDFLNPDNNVGSVVAINLATGARSIFSSSTIPNTANPFGSARGITIDGGNNRALVADTVSKTIVAIDLTNGIRSILSDDDNKILNRPSKLVVDELNNRALIVDDGVLTLDLTTGSLDTFLDFSAPDRLNKFERAGRVTVDSVNQRALVTEGNSVVAVDLQTGSRTILTDGTVPIGDTLFAGLGSIAVDEEKNRALVIVRSPPAVVALDLNTGARTILSDNTTPDSNNPLDFSSNAIAIDSDNNRALVVTSFTQNMIAVDLDTGARTVVSDSSTSNSSIAFDRPFGIAIDAQNGRALVTDNGAEGLIEVNLTTGARRLFSGPFVPDLNNSFSSLLSDVVLDVNNNRALVTDVSQNALIAVNLADGSRTFFSSRTVPDANNKPVDVASVAIDLDNNRALLTDGARIIAIDLTSGERVILSQ